jgi:hypothetical protein
MEINFTKLLGLGALVGGGVLVGRMSNQAGVELQKAALCDEAEKLECDVLLLKDANREMPGDMSHREHAGSTRLLDDVHQRLREFQVKNKSAPDKAADRINDGIDEGVNVVARVLGGVKTVFTPWTWGNKKDETEKTEPETEPVAAAS